MTDAAVISLAETTFLTHISYAFEAISLYAKNLLYIFAIMEIVLFGLIWAISQDVQFGRLFFKILKIGLLFFVLQNFSYLIKLIAQTYADVGGNVTDQAKLTQYLFNPAYLWQYGYNIGAAILKNAASSTLIGMALIQIIIGFGILLSYAVIGIQIVLQIAAFYLVALLSFLFIPFGVFTPGMPMMENAFQQILKAGVRLAVLIVIIGIAITTWKAIGVLHISNPIDFKTSLGLLVSAILFAYLAVRLPSLVASVVGRIDFGRLSTQNNTTVNVSSPTSPASYSPVDQVRAASTISSSTLSPTQQMGVSVNVAAPNIQVSTQINDSKPSLSRKYEKNQISKANSIDKQLSEKLANTIQRSLKQLMDKEK